MIHDEYNSLCNDVFFVKSCVSVYQKKVVPLERRQRHTRTQGKTHKNTGKDTQEHRERHTLIFK